MAAHQKSRGEKTFGLKHWFMALIILVIVSGYLLLNDDTYLMALEARLVEAFEKRQALRDFIMGFGDLAPLIFILIQASQVVLSPIPGEATGFIGGFIFGFPAFFYSTVGLSLGSILAFLIARGFRHRIRSVLEKNTYYLRLESLLQHQGVFVTFLLFVFPGFPKDFLCYFLGMSRMPWEVFLFICTLGRMPGTLMLTFQGADLFEARFQRLALVTGLTLAVLIPMYLKKEAVYRWIEKRVNQ